MANNPRVERPKQTIKTNISPLSDSLKVKAATAIQSVVTAIKNKHM
jgi:hypothetical protein